MRFERFEALAREYWERIPEEYTRGVDGMSVERSARRDEDGRDVWTLGECLTETYPSDFGGPDTIRSAVVVYWGSFRNVAADDPAFDWEHELWETLTHELRHHLESLSGEDALEDVDYAADENFKRLDGETYDPAFYQNGEVVPDGPSLTAGREGTEYSVLSTQYSVEADRFVEVQFPSGRPPPREFHLHWHGSRWIVRVPGITADVTFARLPAPFEPPPTDTPVEEVTLVFVRKLRLRDMVRALFGGRRAVVEEIDAEVERARGEPRG